MFPTEGDLMMQWPRRLLLLSVLPALTACAPRTDHTLANPTGALPLHSPAPDFTLSDSHGKSITLSQLTAKGPVLLIFYLGYSCPRCVAHLQSLAERKPDFDAAGVQILAISPDSVDNLKDSIEAFGDFPFPLLSDPDMHVAHAYGLVASNNTLFHGTYLIDSHNTIRLASKSAHPIEDHEALLETIRACTTPTAKPNSP